MNSSWRSTPPNPPGPNLNSLSDSRDLNQTTPLTFPLSLSLSSTLSTFQSLASAHHFTFKPSFTDSPSGTPTRPSQFVFLVGLTSFTTLRNGDCRRSTICCCSSRFSKNGRPFTFWPFHLSTRYSLISGKTARDRTSLELRIPAILDAGSNSTQQLRVL